MTSSNRIPIFLLSFVLTTASGFAWAGDPAIPHTMTSFTNTKKRLPEVYLNQRTTFYCGCAYSKAKVIDPAACGYTPRKNADRGKRVEWEHIVPAQAFGSTRTCWREPLCRNDDGTGFKGRKCCDQIDPIFKAMEADMHNLVPAIGELNGDRSNRSYGMVEGEPRVYGQCDFEIDYDTDKTEPRPEIRGDIARTYFYMNKTYNIPISNQQQKLFNAWDKTDPVDDWDRERNRRIFAIQGNANPFVEDLSKR